MFPPHDEVKKLSEKVLYFKNNKVNVTELAIVKNAPASYPILHGVNFTLLNRPLRVSFSQNDEVFYIYATVHTAGTEPKEFLFTIERNSEEIKLNTQNLNDFIE